MNRKQERVARIDQRQGVKGLAKIRPASSLRTLTPKQQRFLAYFSDPQSAAFGNATKAAELAGYSGAPGSNQLSVRGAEVLRNYKVQGTIAEMLDGMVEHGLHRLAEAMDATKVQSFLTKDAEIISSPLRPTTPHGCEQLHCYFVCAVRRPLARHPPTSMPVMLTNSRMALPAKSTRR